MKWRLIEVCPILGQVGYKYRLRALNGRILNLDGAGNYSAMVLADAAIDAANKTLVSTGTYHKFCRRSLSLCSLVVR